MSSCLGIYIERNLIKYAKITKEHETITVNSFGIKFYDQIGTTINQIISETSSYKTPISINLTEEVYEYFYFFNLLSKNDLKKAIETEFESFCFDKGYNRNALESRYALVPSMEDDEKIRAIYVYTDKTKINNLIKEFDENAISYMGSLPMCISNIIETKEKENIVIVNLEHDTTLTTILENRIYSIDKIEKGMDTILTSISDKENSYTKAYEICKNTTIYTMEDKEYSSEEENIYLEDIMPTLYSIVQEVKQIIDSSIKPISKVYITGTGCAINNIDLYFQEYFENAKCEILKPYFISDNAKVNIKDYIEVNSALALAMQGLGYGIKTINFKSTGLNGTLPSWLKLNIKSEKNKSKTPKQKNLDSNNDWKAQLDATERWILRTSTGILAFIIIYSGITVFLRNQTNEKMKKTEEVKSDTEKQISLVNADMVTLNNKTSDYEQMTENLKRYSAEAAENLRVKNAIPMLLTRIMNVIPKGVTLTSVENTKGSHIKIYAQSADYDLLGFFKASLIVDGVLSPNTVISTPGEKQGGVVKIIIEGDLP